MSVSANTYPLSVATVIDKHVYKRMLLVSYYHFKYDELRMALLYFYE
jgi:hypothetical protein